MYGGKSTLYDVLGLARDATANDVARSYRRLKSDMERESSAPNVRKAALLHEAYEVLSDPVKRATYDKSLAREAFLGKKHGEAMRVPWKLVGAMAVIAAGAGWWYMKGREPPAPPIKPPSISQQEIQTATSVAVGRVNRVEMSGARSGLGAAVAVEEGVMMAPCEGIAPGVQLLVRIPPRDIPAQLKMADEALGLCKLSVSGGASWPLPMTGLIPRAGDRVYAVTLSPLGDAVVTPGEVKKVTRGPVGAIIESTSRAGPPLEGSPLLDADGRVVAIALKGEHTTLPKAWIVDAPIVKRPPKPEKPAEEPETASAEPADENAKRLERVPPEKRERLEKAFRPPPNVPSDL